MVVGARVLTVQGGKRSDLGWVSSPVWAGTADELYVRHERGFRNASRGFWPKQLEARGCCCLSWEGQGNGEFRLR